MSALDDVIRYHADNCQSGSECDLTALSRHELDRLRAELAQLRAAVNEARELLTTLEWNDWNDSVDAWLAAHPAPVSPEQVRGDWYFSGATEGSIAEFGPFKTEGDALAGKKAAELASEKLHDGVLPRFNSPYQRTISAVTPAQFEQAAPVDWREAQPDERMFDE